MNPLRKMRSLFTRSEDNLRERHRRAQLTSVMNLISQAIALLTGLISVPLSLSYLDPERFGLWMALSTLLSLVAFTDFGVAIGAQDRISHAVSERRYPDARRTFSTSLLFLSGVAAVLVCFSEFAAPAVDWERLYSLKSDAAKAEAAPAVRAFVIVLALGLVSGLLQRTFIALQEGYAAAAINAGARVASLVALIAAVQMRAGLPILILAVTGVSSVVMIALGAPILLIRHRWLIDWRSNFRSAFSSRVLQQTLRIGVLGLLASFAFFAINNAIQFLISTKFGAEQVADFSALYKLLAIPLLLLSNLLNPYWPAITDAKGKGEFHWISATYGRMRKLTVAFTITFSLALLFGGRWAVEAWTGKPSMAPSTSMIAGATVFMIAGFWNSLYSVVLNGLSRFRSQATMGLALASGSTLLAALLPASWPKETIVWTIAAAYVLRCVFLYGEVRRELTARPSASRESAVGVEIRGETLRDLGFAPNVDVRRPLKYVGFYDAPDADGDIRRVSPAAVTKMDYISEVLLGLSGRVLIISPAKSTKDRYSPSKTFETPNRTQVRLLASLGRGSRLKNLVNRVLGHLLLLWHLLSCTRRGETIIVYHSLAYGLAIYIAQKCRALRVVLEVEEVYQDAAPLGPYHRFLERLAFSTADAFIFPTAYLNARINPAGKAFVVVHGTYRAEETVTKRFDDGRTHLVYAGNLDPAKGGSVAAINLGRFLPDGYHVHIIGFGSPAQIASTHRLIDEVRSSSLCVVTYDGQKVGPDYIHFIQKCHIGLSTQDPTGKFNESSFPSKVLSYLSNGIAVLSSRVPAVMESEVGDCIFYYDGQSPAQIAKAVQLIGTDEDHDHRGRIRVLDARFRDGLSKLLNFI